jgi:hypothetical protein
VGRRLDQRQQHGDRADEGEEDLWGAHGSSVSRGGARRETRNRPPGAGEAAGLGLSPAVTRVMTGLVAGASSFDTVSPGGALVALQVAAGLADAYRL